MEFPCLNLPLVELPTQSPPLSTRIYLACVRASEHVLECNNDVYYLDNIYYDKPLFHRNFRIESNPFLYFLE